MLGWWIRISFCFCLFVLKMSNHFYPDSPILMNWPRGSCGRSRSPQSKSSISHDLGWKGNVASSRDWLQPRGLRQMGSLRLLVFLCWSHPVLSSAPPNRSFWNTAAITHSVVKGRTAAFSKRECHSIHQPPGTVYPTDGHRTSTHTGPKPNFGWIFFFSAFSTYHTAVLE